VAAGHAERVMVAQYGDEGERGWADLQLFRVQVVAAVAATKRCRWRT
jgi:hypothetical protein